MLMTIRRRLPLAKVAPVQRWIHRQQRESERSEQVQFLERSIPRRSLMLDDYDPLDGILVQAKRVNTQSSKPGSVPCIPQLQDQAPSAVADAPMLAFEACV